MQRSTADMFPGLSVEDIKIHLFQDSDATVLYKLIDENRHYLRRWLSWVDGTVSVNTVRKFIEEARTLHEERRGLHAGLWLCDKLVGAIGLHQLDWTNRNTSFGYWISECQQGKGIVTRSCRTLIDFCFAGLNLHRIEIRCAPENEKSRSIPEGLGFRYEGTLRHVIRLDDRFVDQIVYGLLLDEWLKHQQ